MYVEDGICIQLNISSSLFKESYLHVFDNNE